MRKSIISVLVVMVLLVAFGCGQKAEVKVEETGEKKVVVSSEIRMDPLPFKKVMGSISSLSKELAVLTPKSAYTVSEDIYKQSFAIGVISADAIMCISSREEDKIKSYTETLIAYSKNIGIKDEILKMADDIQIVLAGNDETKWSKLEKLVLEYQRVVELAFYQEEMLDQYTLMQLGGWAEGLNKISQLYINNWDEKGAKIVNQRGIINALINNLNITESKKILASEYHKASVEGFKMIKEIIYSKSEQEFYSIEEIQSIHDITSKILDVVNK